MLRLLVGLALLPSSVLTLAIAVQRLGALALRTTSAFPFIVGFILSVAAWLFARTCVAGDCGPLSFLGSLVKKIYVIGHELTHALAAWSVGAKVMGFKVSDSGGHVDLSHSNAFIALAPYCLPIYSLFVILGYRILLFLKPGSGEQAIFLGLMGLTLSFHLIKTCECLWNFRQPDLSAAGGIVFSLAWILLANGLIVLLMLKVLFPRAVFLLRDIHRVWSLSDYCWMWIGRGLRPLGIFLALKIKRWAN